MEHSDFLSQTLKPVETLKSLVWKWELILCLAGQIN